MLGLPVAGPAVMKSHGTEPSRRFDAPYPLRFELPIPALLAVKPVVVTPPAEAEPEPVNEASGLALVDGTPPPIAAQGATKAGRSAFLDLDFSLIPRGGTLTGAGGQTISAAKPVIVDGTSAGEVEVRFGQPPAVMVRTADLARAFATVQRDPASLGAATGEFLSFEELRDRGFIVRYDPVREAIQISG